MNYSQNTSVSNALAADARSLNNLKLQAGKGTPAAIKESAKQFESLFMQELVKGMRQTTMKSGMLDSPGSNLASDMLDQQYAVRMSGQPGGLSSLIEAQLTRMQGGTSDTSGTSSTSSALDNDALDTSGMMTTPATSLKKASSIAAYSANAPKPTLNQTKFVDRHTEAAIQIEKETGIPASYMVGQAGHETGWGQFEIKMRGGKPSYNLFGIKADASWKGKVAEVTTTEYVDGTPQKRVAKFRAYDSYDESFRDYAKMITQSPRYAKVSSQTGSAYAFASSLQKAGYATDPQYATKLSRAIEATQRLQQRTLVMANNV